MSKNEGLNLDQNKWYPIWTLNLLWKTNTNKSIKEQLKKSLETVGKIDLNGAQLIKSIFDLRLGV